MCLEKSKQVLRKLENNDSKWPFAYTVKSEQKSSAHPLPIPPALLDPQKEAGNRSDVHITGAQTRAVGIQVVF